MYCGHCGALLSEKDRFCGKCGQSIPLSGVNSISTQLSTAKQPLKIPKMKLSSKSKWIVGVSGSIIASAVVIYSILHMTYGPSTPEKLGEQLQQAIAAHDVDPLLTHLDPSSDALRKPEVVAAFRKAFNGETTSSYEDYLKEAVYMAAHEQTTDKGLGIIGADNFGPFQLVKQTSWRGTKWNLKITPSTASFEKNEGWSAISSIETLQSDSGSFENLWPAYYAYNSEVSNPYGGKEVVEGTVNLMDDSNAEIDLSHSLQSEVSFHIPKLEGIHFKLNGVALPDAADDPFQRVTLAPQPASMEIGVEGSYFNKKINYTAEIDPSENNYGQSYDLGNVLKQGLAEEVVNLIFEVNQSWTEAHNTHNPALLKGLNPEGNASQTFLESADNTDTTKIHLVRVGIIPSDIQLSETDIQVTASEEYAYPGSDRSNDVASNTYTITPQPGTETWWIDSYNHNYFLWNDIFNQSNNLVKNNPED